MKKIFRAMLSFPDRLIGDPGIAPPRRADLDWLRILAFGLLILYHVGMLYVADWGWHVKSKHSSESLQSVMLLVNPWRMPVLWLVSGIAIRFVLAKVSVWRFLGLRSVRLLLPLLFGILVVVPPQLYYEMSSNGDLAVGYLEFYRAFFEPGNPMFKDYASGIWPHMDVNHLWYLRELWLFSIYLLFLLPVLNSRRVAGAIDWLSRQRGLTLLGLAAAPILAIELALDDTREEIGFAFLVYGYLLGWHEAMWNRLRGSWRTMLSLGVGCYLLLVFFYNAVWLNEPEEMRGWVLAGGGAIYGTSRVVWLVAVLGLAATFLDRQSRWLIYFNEAVYSYYILHQTVIIVCYAHLQRFGLGPVLEPLSVMACTAAVCALGFEIIRRVSFLRPLFGLKARAGTPLGLQRAGLALAGILLVPFALEILL